MLRNDLLILFFCANLAIAATPQAATHDELDAFGRAYEAPDPLEQIRACEVLPCRYPGSEFRERLWNSSSTRLSNEAIAPLRNEWASIFWRWMAETPG